MAQSELDPPTTGNNQANSQQDLDSFSSDSWLC